MKQKSNLHPKIKLVAITLIIVMFLLSLFSSSGLFSNDNPGDAGIVDEIAHIPAGYSYLKFADYRLNPEHPPLVKDLAAIPLLFLDLKFPTNISAWKDEVNGQWECGWKFIYERGNNPEQVFFWSRLLPMCLIFLLGFYLWKWTKELFGENAALFAIFLMAFSPNLITNARYVTTDFGVAVFLFISIYYFTKFLKKPGWATLVLATITFALASLSKFSAILLIPYFALLLLAAIIVRRKDIKDFISKIKWKRIWTKRIFIYLVSGIIILVIGHIFISLPYIHHTANMPSELQHQLINESLPQQEGLAVPTRAVLNKLADIPGGKALAQYFLGAAMVFNRVGGGNSAFLVGDYSNYGWWYYYFVSFFLKVPIPILILTAITIAIGFYVVATEHKKVKIPPYENKKRHWFERLCRHIWHRWDIFVIITVMLMFWLAGIKSTANIGIRWMIPTFPFLYILIAGAVTWWLRRGSEKRKEQVDDITHRKISKLQNAIKILVIGVLCVWYFTGTLFAYPTYLSYFNEFIGKGENSYKYLVDSNLDWGQDLNRLAVWTDKNNINEIYVDYFGGGVPVHSLGANRAIEWHSKCGLPPEGSYLAVSATFYQMSEFFARRNGEVSYVRILDREPDYEIGNSILIYKITKEDLDQFKSKKEVLDVAKPALANALVKYQNAMSGTVELEEIDINEITVTSDTATIYEPIPEGTQRPAYEVVLKATYTDFTDAISTVIIPVYVDRISGEVLGL